MRPPTIQEMNFSLPYLIAQIEIIKPKVLVALGKTAVDGLLGPDKIVVWEMLGEIGTNLLECPS